MAQLTYREALEIYESNAGGKAGYYARRYLQTGDGKTDHRSDQVFTRYINGLVDLGMKPGTADLHRRMCQAFFRASNQMLIDRRQLPMHVPTVRGWHYDGKESRRVFFDGSPIPLLVEAAKNGALSPAQVFWLMLATVYGMRAVEIGRVRPEHIDLQGERIYIDAAKGSVKRWCWFPPELHQWVPLGVTPKNAGSVTKAFGAIWRRVFETERTKGAAWHAIRRSLTEGLKENGVPKEDRQRFLRWKTGVNDMDELYSTPNVAATVAGEVAARKDNDAGTRQFDAKAWDGHPHLRLWA